MRNFKFRVLKIFLLVLSSILGSISGKALPWPETYDVEIKLEKPGDLRRELGDRFKEITSICITGVMNYDDLECLWEATFYGNLEILDMGWAFIEKGRIPPHAFYRPEVQVNPEDLSFTPIKLKMIYIPEGVHDIEESSFSYALNLEELGLPSSLRNLGKFAFSNCVNLKSEEIIFPWGFGDLGAYAFANCSSLTGKLYLPTVDTIGEGAFYGCRFSEAEMPEGCDYAMEGYAFYGNRFKELEFTYLLARLSGTYQFANNTELEYIFLPEFLRAIPKGFLAGCCKLRKVFIPITVKEIGERAFEDCNLLPRVFFPKGLKTIGDYAFLNCHSLREINIPLNVVSIGVEAFANTFALEKVSCEALIPPVCESTEDSSLTSFGNPEFYSKIPLYVPKGSGELYRVAEGWKHFSNIIESEELYKASIEELTPDSATPEYFTFDGVRVNSADVKPGLYIVRRGSTATKEIVK